MILKDPEFTSVPDELAFEGTGASQRNFEISALLMPC
jgi:hypothetical protein